MIPSFYPVKYRLKGKIKSLRADPNTGLEIQTLQNLLDNAKKVRYPDLPHFSYPEMLAGEFSNQRTSPFTLNGSAFWTTGNKPRIAVVGGGMSGLLSAWQLSKLGASVDLFEASDEPNNTVANPQGAGRIKPVNITPGDQNTRVEFGAMRFPDTSYLFWHYLKVSKDLSLNQEFTEFPNPGKVPTYLSGDKSISPYWGPGGIEDLFHGVDGEPNYQDLQNKHIDAFIEVTAEGLNLGEISEIMLGGSANPQQLTQVQKAWESLSKTYYNVSYHNFLVNKGFTSDEIRVLGYLGLGTGGFEPLFDTSVLDVMRLIVWNYAAEYAVPDLYTYPFALKEKLRESIDSNGGALNYSHSVGAVFYNQSSGKYHLQVNGSTSHETYYDYVVLAMTHKAAYSLLTRQVLVPSRSVQPYSSGPDSLLRDDIRDQQAMSSVKIFQTMGGPDSTFSGGPFSSITPTQSVNYNQSLRVVFGKTGLDPIGVSYMLPYGNDGVPRQRLLGLQYSWGQDSVTLGNTLLAKDTQVSEQINAGGIAIGRHTVSSSSLITFSVYGATQSRLVSKETTSNVINGTTHPNFFLPDRPPHSSSPVVGEGYYAVVYWDKVPNINMGFKLDAPGKGMRSIYHFKKLATTPGSALLPGSWDTATAIDHSVKGLYFSGDSFSHYGGWVEGAFQAALNTVAGIVYAAADALGQKGQLSRHTIELIEQARTPASGHATNSTT